MKAVVQRVQEASVSVAGETISRINKGIVTLLGVGQGDTEAEMQWLMKKIVNLRIFEDAEGKMNRSLLEIGGEHLVVSQFTLYGDTAKGNRPSFIEAARPDDARPLYEKALAYSSSLGVPTRGGRFQASMQVALINEGPVTLILEAPKSVSS